MKNILPFLILLFISSTAIGQKTIELPFEPPNNILWEGGEKQFHSKDWDTEVITNVSTPTLTLYKPEPHLNNGTCVIIAPGGGLFALSIESEGNQVAKWLNKKGITALVLKYRLVPTGSDGVAEITQLSQNNPAKIGEEVGKVIPYSISDGLEAVKYVRLNAKALEIDPNKIGFMGFSAGGAVTMGVAYNYAEISRPDFLVPVYAWTDVMPVKNPKKDAPPMIVICSSDDPLGLAAGSVQLYNSWYQAKLNVALHMYSQGGHGFGMRKKNLPSDSWIDRFYEWSVAEGLTIPKQ